MIEYPAGFDQTKLCRKPICGVLAVAIGAGVSYPVAHAACKAAMLPHQRRFGGRTYCDQRDFALSRLAVKFTVIKPNFSCSVLQFCTDHADDGFIYLIEIRGHVMTYKDGYIIDQMGCVPWQLYARRKVRLQRAVRIDGKGW